MRIQESLRSPVTVTNQQALEFKIYGCVQPFASCFYKIPVPLPVAPGYISNRLMEDSVNAGSECVKVIVTL